MPLSFLEVGGGVVITKEIIYYSIMKSNTFLNGLST